MSKVITVRDMQDRRILGLSYKTNNLSVLFINVYFPANRPENRDEQLLCLGKIASLIDDADENMYNG